MKLHTYALKGCSLALFVCALAVSRSAFAFHLDVGVWMENNRLQNGFCPDASLGCDSLSVLSRLGLPDDQLPTDYANGRKIFLADFGDLAGGSDKSDNPGFQGLSGWLPADTLIKYRAVDTLQYWRPDAQDWVAAEAGGAQIRLFGGLDSKTIISTDSSKCDGLMICIPKEVRQTVYNEASTVFTGQGIEAASSLIIDNTSASGALHAHLDWFLENAGGTGDAAYLLALQLVAEGYEDSEPFQIMFNHGLSEANFAKAIHLRITSDSLTAVPIPAALPMFISAMAAIGFFQHRKRFF